MTGAKPVLDPRRNTAAGIRRRRAAAFRKVFFGLFAAIIIAISAILGYTHTSPLEALGLLKMGGAYLTARGFHEPAFHGRKHVNILILGTDVNFVDKGIPRSDTIKVASVDVDKPSISILSIPRDTWVVLPDGDHGKINGAYPSGGKSEGNRIARAQTAVTGLMAEYYGQPVPIDYYVRIQTGGFKRIVDAMGGIELNVEKQMDYDDNYQNLYIHLKPGLQVLDGRKAMGYVRFRHDFEGDYGRMRRQDQFIRALVAQINKPEMKSRLPRMLGPIISLMKTDLTLNDIRTLKELAGKIGFDGIYSAQLPTTPGMKGRASVVEVDDPDAARQTISEILNGPRPTVTVVNGSGKRNLGREVSDAIDTNRFNVVAVGTLKEPVAISEVIAAKRCQQDAQALATQLGVQEVDTESPAPAADFGHQIPPPSQITLVLGKDYTAPQQARLTP